MDLTLIEMPDGFESDPGFNEQWWRPRISQNDSILLSAVERSGSEVVRVEMIDRTYPSEYLGVTDSPDFIKIQFIEVRGELRCRGFGLKVLSMLADRYAERRLLAFSEADGFWERAGWSRHIHREDDPTRPRHQALYIRPS